MEYVWFCALVAVMLAWKFRHAIADLVNKRDEALREFAATRGWSYRSSGAALAENWTGEPFSSGDNRRAKYVLRGMHGDRKIVAFDYLYDQRFGRSKETFRYAVVAVELPGELPFLQVTHEGPLDSNDLQFEHDGFNQTFRVRAAEPRYGHAVIHPRMMELLLTSGEIAWRIEGSTIVGWSRGAHQPAEIISRLQLLDRIADLIPPFIWRDYAGIDPRPAAGGDRLDPGSG